jgi:hypothetical protein
MHSLEELSITCMRSSIELLACPPSIPHEVFLDSGDADLHDNDSQ